MCAWACVHERIAVRRTQHALRNTDGHEAGTHAGHGHTIQSSVGIGGRPFAAAGPVSHRTRVSPFARVDNARSMQATSVDIRSDGRPGATAPEAVADRDASRKQRHWPDVPIPNRQHVCSTSTNAGSGRPSVGGPTAACIGRVANGHAPTRLQPPTSCLFDRPDVGAYGSCSVGPPGLCTRQSTCHEATATCDLSIHPLHAKLQPMPGGCAR